MTSLVDFDTLEDGLADKAAAYASALPFPHIVVDGVLTADVFAGAAARFPGIDDPTWKGYLHVNETKYSNTKPDTWDPALQDVAAELCGERFVAYLERLTGISGLQADWSMDGGGLHQTLRGGHLNIHADFTTHHVHLDWARRVNVLLYLNEEWDPAWGGDLELWDREMTARHAKVTPAGNRMLVFTTTEDSFHGHPDGLLVPEGAARKSMALYYFTEESSTVRRATNYRPRPQDGVKGLAIGADRVLLDIYDRAKRRLGIKDAQAQKVLGAVDRVRRRWNR